jgi:hypothetical protein
VSRPLKEVIVAHRHSRQVRSLCTVLSAGLLLGVFVAASTASASEINFGFHVSWVAAYKQCGSPGNPANAQHRPPLSGGSCSPAVLANPNVRGGAAATEWPLDFDYITGGTCPNGGPAVGGPDICIQTSMNDVETATGAPYDPTPGQAGADLGVVARIRITDNDNCTPAPCNGPYSANGTASDLDFGPIPIDCEADTSGPGSKCGASTTANAVYPGVILPGRPANFQLFRARLIQPGASAATSLVAQQGLAWPSVAETTPPTFGGLKSAVTCLPGPVGGGRSSTYNLSWDPATDNVSPPSRIVYDVYQANAPGGENFSTPTYTSAAGATSFATPPLSSDQNWYFVVRARDEAGNSDSNKVERQGQNLCD